MTLGSRIVRRERSDLRFWYVVVSLVDGGVRRHEHATK